MVCKKGFPFLFELCLATIGVAFFGATLRLSHFFILSEDLNMQEHLNDKEKDMLIWLGNQYFKHYETCLAPPSHDFEVIDEKPVDVIRNIIEALELRNYISFGKLYLDRTYPAEKIYLKEKALNLFNSDAFEIMKQEQKKKGLPTK